MSTGLRGTDRTDESDPAGSPYHALLRATASRLARAGRYDEALRELEPAGGGSSTDPAVLDLVARIHAQRGELAEADACWARVQEIDPDSAGAREGRAGIAETRSAPHRPQRRRTLGPWVVAGVAAAVLAGGAGGAIGGVLLTDEPAAPPPAAAPQAPMPVPQPGAGSDGADRAALDRAAEALAGAPVVIERRDDRLVVTFLDGLFVSGNDWSDTGLERTRDVGRRLAAAGPDVTFTVVGHTAAVGDVAVDGGAVELGLARARAASRELAAAGPRPLTDFPITSAGQPLVLTNESGDQGPNRTVSIVVQPG